MKHLFIDNGLKYTGLELAPHWIYKNYKIQGDAIVAFVGECEVHLTEMVDIEDVINNEPIYSKCMLNFIAEMYNIGLVEGVLRQRLLISTIKEVLENDYGMTVKRNGDDLFINNKKLSVSIATKSITSVLIHTGINIDATGAPVDAAELNSLIKELDIKDFANKIMVRYTEELEDIVMASTKVQGR